MNNYEKINTIASATGFKELKASGLTQDAEHLIFSR